MIQRRAGAAPALPALSPVAIPTDAPSMAAWAWANRTLPAYLLRHSVRSYAWGAAIADAEGWGYDARILWTAALFHDVGLTRVPRNRRCFELEGADIAGRFLRRVGMPPSETARVAKAIVDHMAPGVTLADGVESVLLDRATGIDVRGVEFTIVDGVRDAVMRDLPRLDFDQRFVAAIGREVARRTDCQSRRLLVQGDLAAAMVASPWRAYQTTT